MKVTLEDGRKILTIRADGEEKNLTKEEALEIVKKYISNREKERKWTKTCGTESWKKRADEENSGR